jgi:NitT/TauT family transport system substrate-binding protein
MFYEPKDAVDFVSGEEIKKTTAGILKFIIDHQWMNAKDAIGVSFPDGSIVGNKKNVKLYFDTTYMQQAADGVL